MEDEGTMSWYYMKAGFAGDERVGPLSDVDFFAHCLDGNVKATTQVAHPSTSGQWVAASTVELFQQASERLSKDKAAIAEKKRAEKQAAREERRQVREQRREESRQIAEELERNRAVIEQQFQREQEQRRAAHRPPPPQQAPVAQPVRPRSAFAAGFDGAMGCVFGLIAAVILIIAGLIALGNMQ